MKYERRDEGPRAYFVGQFYPVRGQLSDAGAHWDGERKAYWIGKGKADALAQTLEAIPEPNGDPKAQTLQDSDRVIGKATYKGKPGYLLLWLGETKRGLAAKLAFRDGSKIFWADQGEIKIEKRYEPREYRGHTEYMTFGRLKALRARYAEEQKAGQDPNAPTRTCWECGRAFTYAEARANDGDWQGNHCGC